MAYNRAFDPDALPAHAEPEQAAQVVGALVANANRKPSPGGRTGLQPVVNTGQGTSLPQLSPSSSSSSPPVVNRRPSPAAIAARQTYRPQPTQHYHDPNVPLSYLPHQPNQLNQPNQPNQYRLGSPPPANYGYGPRPEAQAVAAGRQRQQSNPLYQHLPPRTPAPPDADSPDLYSIFQAANVSRTGALTTQELGSALVNGDFTPFDGTTIKSLMRMFSTSPSSAVAGGATITFTEFQALWRFLAAWRELFERFDEDYSGRISLAEFSKALVAFGYRLSQPFVTLLYKTYNDRGVRRGSLAGQAMAPADLGMSFDLFVQACISLKRMTDVFKQYDEDRDGYITVSFEEFLSEILKLSE